MADFTLDEDDEEVRRERDENEETDNAVDAVIDNDDAGNLIRKSGIMGIVLEGGEIKLGDKIVVKLPQQPFVKLIKV